MGTQGKKLKPRALDLTGRRFGLLMVEHQVGVTKYGHAVWSCVCDCGERIDVQACRLLREHTRSCGCIRRGDHWNRRGNLKHGHTVGLTPSGSGRPSILYATWSSMIQRCTNPKAQNYKYYGGRGIAVCPQWLTFVNFAADMGERPGCGFSIDRIDNDGNYEPGNCRWATQSQQVRNSRRSRREVAV